MKILIFLLLPISALSQRYFSVSSEFMNTSDGFKPGVILSGGGFLKNDDNKRAFKLGAGVGVFVVQQGDDPYFPLFLEGGYFNKEKRISPYVNARVGYGFYKGSLFLVEQTGPAKGGLFGNLSAGLGIRVAKPFFVVPNFGMSIINLRHRVLDDGYSKGLFTVGLTLFFAR